MHLPGLSKPTPILFEGNSLEHVMLQRPLQRVLAFTGRSIHDVINCPIARNEVYGFFKLHKQILRQSEIRDLESQWNPLGQRL
jgi:hypothetical protein